MDMGKITDKLNVLDDKPFDVKLKLLYQWVKADSVNFKEFEYLLEQTILHRRVEKVA